MNSTVNQNPRYSVIIPVKNGASTIERCLTEVFNQTIIKNTEVIIIDSGSTDGTLKILEKYPVRLFQIHPKEFNHGLTRNFGVKQARGEFVVMTVQDAWPADDRWLEKLTRHFDDPEVTGVCGQQIVPHEKDKNPHEWFRPVNPPSIDSYQFNDFAGFESLDPKEKRWVCRWDNVTTMYIAEVLKNDIPFKKVGFGEDIIWAKDAYRQGYKLVYDTSARVYHYHHIKYKSMFERKVIEFQLDWDLFRLKHKPKSLLLQILRLFYWQIRRKIAVKWFLYSLKKIITTNRAAYKVNKLISKCV